MAHKSHSIDNWLPCTTTINLHSNNNIYSQETMHSKNCSDPYKSLILPSRYTIQKNVQTLFCFHIEAMRSIFGSIKNDLYTYGPFLVGISKKVCFFCCCPAILFFFLEHQDCSSCWLKKRDFPAACRRMQNIEWKKSHIFFHLKAIAKKFQNSMLPDAVLSHLCQTSQSSWLLVILYNHPT